MEIQVKYSGLEDRQVKVNEQEAKGLRMLFDNFDDPNWHQSDPLIGTMTFTDKPEPLPVVNPVEVKRKEAHSRAIQAIKDNIGASPWGKILNDLAIAQGWIEPL